MRVTNIFSFQRLALYTRHDAVVFAGKSSILHEKLILSQFHSLSLVSNEQEWVTVFNIVFIITKQYLCVQQNSRESI
jgi:hypothetical protein